jgi:hypothetical protein
MDAQDNGVEFHYSWLLVLIALVGLIQVDIGGHPPIPTGSKQSSGNLLYFAVFRFLNFWGHFEGLNEVFSGSSTSMKLEGSE